MKACYKCATELAYFDEDTRRWFEGTDKPHYCEKIPLFTNKDAKGKMGFFAHVRPELVAKNITDIAVKNHWKPERLNIARMGDNLIIKPR